MIDPVCLLITQSRDRSLLVLFLLWEIKPQGIQGGVLKLSDQMNSVYVLTI